MYDVHADHLNTPRVIVNSRNTTIWRWNNAHAFDANLPFKDPDNNDQTLEYNPRFPGQYFDKETNLHYNYFRHYESETGRYISPDPMGIAGGDYLDTYHCRCDIIYWLAVHFVSECCCKLGSILGKSTKSDW